MKKKTEKNPKGAGRPPMFKIEHGKTIRIKVSIPIKKEKEIRKEIDIILEPYKT